LTLRPLSLFFSQAFCLAILLFAFSGRIIIQKVRTFSNMPSMWRLRVVWNFNVGPIKPFVFAGFLSRYLAFCIQKVRTCSNICPACGGCEWRGILASGRLSLLFSQAFCCAILLFSFSGRFIIQKERTCSNMPGMRWLGVAWNFNVGPIKPFVFAAFLSRYLAFCIHRVWNNSSGTYV
jgi:hypothetical protein